MTKLNVNLRTAPAVLFPALVFACGLRWVTAALAQSGIGLGPPPKLITYT